MTSLRDPFVRNVLTPVTSALFLLLSAPALVAIMVLAYTSGWLEHGFFTLAEPSWLERVRLLVFGFKGLPADISVFLAQVLPALAGAICFRSEIKDGRLSWPGRGIFLLLLIVAGSALASVSIIDPDNPEQADGFVDGFQGLVTLRAGAEATLRLAATYLLMLIGLRVPISASTGSPEGK